MLFPELAVYGDFGLLLLRVITALVFLSSGFSHVTKVESRSESIGMGREATISLGVWQMVGALSVLLGIFAQIGAVMLIVVMFGAIYKKIFVWKLGFWGEKSMGWHYDVIFLISNLLILFTGGGSLILL